MDPFRVMDTYSEAFEYQRSHIRISSKYSYLNWVPELIYYYRQHADTPQKPKNVSVVIEELNKKYQDEIWKMKVSRVETHDDLVVDL